MKRTIILLASVIISVQISAIEIKNLGLIPICAINNYWIDDGKVLYIPSFRQNELRVFDLASLQDRELLHEGNISTWRLNRIFNPIDDQKGRYLHTSFTIVNRRDFKGAVIETRNAEFYFAPDTGLSFPEKMSAYGISKQDDGVRVSVLDVLADMLTSYTIPWDSFKGIDSRKERFNPLKFQDYDPETGKVTISYSQRSIADSFTHYTANIIDGKLENIKLMFADDSGEPKYGYSNQMWILKNGLYLAAKYKYNLNTRSDSIPYATLIIVDADGNEIYEYPDFEMRMFDEYFFRLSPDRTKILLWGSYIKDDKPGEATYLLEIKYD